MKLLPTLINPNSSNSLKSVSNAAAAKLSLAQTSMLRKWRGAVADVRSQTADCSVLWVQDSTAFFGSTGTQATMRYNGLCNILANMFNDAGIPAVANGFCGDGNGHGDGATSKYDDRLVVGAGWNENTTKFVGGSAFTATSATSSLAFTPKEGVDKFTFTYFHTGSGGLNYNVNGAADTLESYSGGNGITTVTVSCPTLGNNTLNINWASGSGAFVYAFDAYDSSRKQVHFLNAGWSGQVSLDVSSSLTVSGAQPYRLGQKLTALCLGINDSNTAVPVATFKAQMQLAITEFLTQGDVVIMTFTPQNPATQASQVVQDSFTSAIKDLAAANSIGLVDLNALFEANYATYNAAGYMADNAHPNSRGYNDQAPYAFDTLVAFAGGPVFRPSTVYGHPVITPVGSTGAKTINARAGCVRFAAAAGSLVVTNSLVTTNSVIKLQIAANDATCTSVNYTPASGSFTINAPTVPTAEMRVDFEVIN